MKARMPATDQATPPAFDKRSLAEPEEMPLADCPKCGAPGVPLVTTRPLRFCLRCDWVESAAE
jgi:hypothetical protein